VTTSSSPDPASQSPLSRVFIGSSAEGLETARFLQSEIEKLVPCEATCWDQDVFTLSSFTLSKLLEVSKSCDFAILMASPDDSATRRGVSSHVPRDNVIFELGLFVSALGSDRTFLIVDQTIADLRLPSDLAGLTYGAFKTRQDGNVRASLNTPVLGIVERIRTKGLRTTATEPSTRADQNSRALESELELVCKAALAQGWKVRKKSATTLRLQDRKGRKHTLSLGRPTASRSDLRDFAKKLRAYGLRIDHSVRRPVSESVHG
jgi:hypothetical protein